MEAQDVARGDRLFALRMTAKGQCCHREIPAVSQRYLGRIYIERINAPFLFKLKDIGTEFGAGLKYAIERGWLQLHESGTYVMPFGEDLLTRNAN